MRWPIIFLLSAAVGGVVADCPADTSVTIVDGQNQPVCLCSSTYFSSNCGQQATDNGCELESTEALETVQDMRVDSLSFQDPNVVVDISGNMMSSRRYVAFAFGDCPIGAMNTFTVETVDSVDCRDRWRAVMPFIKLIGGCGFSNYTQVTKDQILYQRYIGQLKYDYEEQITIGTGKFAMPTMRSSTTALPFVIDVQSSYGIELGDNLPPINIYSDFHITAAIVAQKLVPGDTTSTIDLAYVTYFPYQAISFPTELQVTENRGDIVSAGLINEDGSPYPQGDNNAPPCDGSKGVGQGSYTVGGDGCFNTLKVQFIHGQGCFVNATFTLPDIKMGCAQGILATDCPLQGGYGVTRLSFNYETSNICLPDGPANKINGLVSVEAFLAVPTDAARRDNSIPAVQQNQWVYGLPLVMRMDFGGVVSLSDAEIARVDTDWTDTGFKTVYDRANPQLPVPPESMYRGSLTGSRREAVPLGFDRSLQSLLMTHVADSTFSSLNDHVTNPTNGAASSLRVRMTIDVSYTEPNQRRRRREAADAMGAAASVLSPQTIVHNPDYYETTAPTTVTSSSSRSSSGSNTIALVLWLSLLITMRLNS